ncbi:MAG: phosphatase PAP2 family protein [Ruminococcaceae bacterium]|nr:phosphatase PAP2 family protein [Oscillospiraceae bacterium]
MAEWLDTVFKGFDFALFRAMHDLALAAGEPMTALMRFISFFAHDGLCMFALGLLLMCFRRTRKMGACVFLAVCCGGLITNITLKNLVGRIRPYANFSHLASTVEGWWQYVGSARLGEAINTSFPSGHTTSATAAMVGLFLASRHKKRTWPVLLFPFLMGISRIYLMVHYGSDVLAGLASGTLGAVAAYALTRLLWRKLEEHRERRFCAFVLEFDLAAWIASLKKRDAAAQ